MDQAIKLGGAREAGTEIQPERALADLGPVLVHTWSRLLPDRKMQTHNVTGSAQGGILAGMNFNAVIERDLETGLLVGSVPGIPGAHTQGETIEEVRTNLAEVIELLQSENALEPESEFIATTALMVA